MPLGSPLFLQDSVLPYCTRSLCQAQLNRALIATIADVQYLFIFIITIIIEFNGENL